MGIGSSIIALTTASVLAFSGVAYADTIEDTITDNTTGLSLEAGSTTGGQAAIKLLNENSRAGDSVNQCNVASTTPLVLDITVPAGVSAHPSRISITGCALDYPVTFTAAANAVSGSADVRIVSQPAEGRFVDNVSIPITITQPNTEPTVVITGVTDGAEYKDNAVPAAGCSVTDAEDVNPTATPQISNLPADGLGSHTVTCDYTDKGGLQAVTAKATYSVVTSNTKPTVAVTGVTDGAEYKDNAVPTAGCSVTDAEDVNPTAAPQISNLPADGLGSHTVTCGYTDRGGLAADQKTATYTVIPSNTKPTVAVTGVVDGKSYEIKSEPTAGCSVTDAEDGSTAVAPVLTGTLSHGLGTQTVTCDYTDQGGLKADTATMTYTIVDTGKPTITATLTSAKPKSNGWYSADVLVHFECADNGSGIADCTSDTTLGEAKDQSVTGTATDWAGNTATDVVSGVNVDKTAPTITAVSGISDYFFGASPGTASCTATDGLSGLEKCEVTGFGLTAAGKYSAIATATDLAGNVTIEKVAYEVKPWKATGFYSPVDMSGVVNTVKGGSTVPLKFEAFGASEFTNTAVVKSFGVKSVACGAFSGAADDVELITAGKTELRYDAVAGQFIQNWQTPKSAGSCYVVTMTLQDDTSLSANFKLK